MNIVLNIIFCVPQSKVSHTGGVNYDHFHFGVKLTCEFIFEQNTPVQVYAIIP